MKRRVKDPRAWLHRERPARGAGFDPRSRALIETRTGRPGAMEHWPPAACLGRRGCCEHGMERHGGQDGLGFRWSVGAGPNCGSTVRRLALEES
jgi:hypothetical protein